MDYVSLWFWVACLIGRARTWNSHLSTEQLYSFQDFYTDAQYGPDFGYYSTGRILHVDGLNDAGAGGQEWFNSYTTLPMSLSPHFGHALCDRLVAMWAAMDRPKPFVVTEFGGGTGMLARDVLRRARDAHGEFYESMARYIIAERSQAMRSAQTATAGEFVPSKLTVLAADGRRAASLRASLEAEMRGDGSGAEAGAHPVVGILLSNELLDEFDPVKLRLVWRLQRPPSKRRCGECSAYREAYVAHTIDTKALIKLVKDPEGPDSVEMIRHEGQLAYCGLLATAALRRVALSVAEDLTAEERWQCAPMLVCCFPFVLAMNSALQYHHEVLYQAEVEHRDEHGERDLVKQYRTLLRTTNETVPLTKDRYRQLRRMAAQQGSEVEKALLFGVDTNSTDPHVSNFSGRLRSLEIYLALTPERCRELAPWRRRHAARLAHAARLRDVSAPAFGTGGPGHTAAHLKLVLRPGEAEFVRETAKLLDEGFLVTLDYGADADALLWFAAIRPHYEGIHIMDARAEFLDVCTLVSHLECPGLQDLTTSVDFTEVAMAGAEWGWKQKAYGPIWLLELAFGYGLGHLLERAGGLQSPSLQAWYLTPEQDPWASFKILVQHRGQRGAGWSLGPLAQEWPLSPLPRLLRGPSPCWSRDITKPPLASLVTTATHQKLGDKAWKMYMADSERSWHTNSEAIEDESVADALSQHFLAFLLQENISPLADQQGEAQQRAYAAAHLAAMLVDYWHHLQQFQPEGDNLSAWGQLQEQVRSMAANRMLPMLYGERRFDEVFRRLTDSVFTLNRSSSLGNSEASPPYLCLAEKAWQG